MHGAYIERKEKEDINHKINPPFFYTFDKGSNNISANGESETFCNLYFHLVSNN